MALRVAYIHTDEPVKKPKKLTKKQEIQQLAMCILAKRRVRDEQRAIKMFAPEMEEIKQLEKKLRNADNIHQRQNQLPAERKSS